MKKLLTLKLIFLSILPIIAQSPISVDGSVRLLNTVTNNAGSIPVFDLRYEGIRGSKFFYDEYTEGEVWLTNNRHYTNEYKYKFDEEGNTVNVLDKKGNEFVLKSYEIEEVKLYIKGSTVTFFRMDMPDKSGNSRLFQVLFIGKKYTLLKLPARKFVKVEKTGAYSSGEIYHEYANISRYFLKAGDKPFEEIRMTKRNLIKAMPQKRHILEEFYEENEGKDIKDYEIAELLNNSENKDFNKENQN